MADTEYHVPPSTLFDEDPTKDDGVDWEQIDRLIILMSLALTERFIRKRRTSFDSRDPDIKIRVLDRMKELIEDYKQPRERGRKRRR